jgi:hypothetical protein
MDLISQLNLPQLLILKLNNINRLNSTNFITASIISTLKTTKFFIFNFKILCLYQNTKLKPPEDVTDASKHVALIRYIQCC